MSLYFCLEVLHLNGKFTNKKKNGFNPFVFFLEPNVSWLWRHWPSLL